MEERLRYLFEKYLDNACTREELEEFFNLVSRAKHDDALRELVRDVYAGLQQHPSPLNYVNENGQLVLNEPSWLPPPAEKRKTFSKRGVLLASAVALAVTAAGLLTNMRPWQTSAVGTQPIATLTKKTTDRSESKYIQLADGTEVWLNAASSLRFPDQFDARKREVYLSGEAFFEVKHAEKIPFIIHTGTVSTEVLGTAFNIKAYPGQKSIIVSVSRGKVKVNRDNQPVATLTTGQQVRIGESSTAAVVEKNIAADKIAAWQEGNLIFEDEAFGDIIDDIERTYNASIEVENKAILELRVSTSFKKEIGVEQALQVLCKLTDTQLKTEGKNYRIQ